MKSGIALHRWQKLAIENAMPLEVGDVRWYEVSTDFSAPLISPMRSNRSRIRNAMCRTAMMSVELILVSVVALAILIVAFAALRDSAISELSDVAGSVDDANQSYTYAGSVGGSGSSPGSGFQDQTDSPDDPDDLAGQIDNGIRFTDPIDEGEGFAPLLSTTSEAEGPDVIATTGGGFADGWNVWSNGEISITVDIPVNGNYRFSSRLWGQQGGPDLPNAAFLVDGVPQENFNISETSFAAAGIYFVDVNLTAGTYQFGVQFTNDYYAPPIDRNLLVDWLMVEGPN